MPKALSWRPDFRTGFRKKLGRRQHYQKLAGVGRQLPATSYLFKKPNKKEELKTKANFFNFWARDFPLVPKAPSWPPELRTGFRKIFWGREHGQNQPGVRRLVSFGKFVCFRLKVERFRGCDSSSTFLPLIYLTHGGNNAKDLRSEDRHYSKL